MAWWIWLLLILIVLLGCMIAFFFFVAMVRLKPRTQESMDKDVVWGRYKERLKEATALIQQYPREAVEITSFDGLKLRGCFFPVNHARGTLLMMHGYRGEGLHDFTWLLPFCRSLGLNALVPDQRAHGLSEGRYICYGIKERYDCLDWLHFINTRVPEKLPLFMDGVSMGGATVLMATGLSLPDNVRGVIADCGFTSPWEIMKHVCRASYHAPTWPLLPLCNLISRHVAQVDFRAYSTLEAMKVCKLPILFVHGGKDAFVPPEMTKENYAACHSEKQLLIVENATHATSYLEDTPRCEAAMKDFIEAHIG